MAGTVAEDLVFIYTPENPPPYQPDWNPETKAVVDFPKNASGKEFARKVFELASPTKHDLLFEKDKAKFISELKLLRHAQHQHVIRLVRAYIFESDKPKLTTHAAIIMERAESFRDFLDGRPNKQMQQWFSCLATAMAYIHGIGIRHRDIKPDNILVKDKKVLLADFGISKMVLGKTLSTTKAADPRDRTTTHCAPEVEGGGTRGRSADIFSLGAVFLDMLVALSLPRDEFERTLKGGGNDDQISYAKNLTEVHESIDRWKNKSPGWRANLLSLCQKMLHEDTDERPDAFKVADDISSCGLPKPPKSCCKCTSLPEEHDSLLLHFCRKGLKEDVENLLRCERERLKDTMGAIHQASAHGHLAIVKLLLEDNGFNVNLQDHTEQTALHSAAGYGEEEVINYLLLQEADTRIRDSDGRTALHYAAGHGKLEIVDRLLSVWHDGLHVRDDDGRTALHFAAARGHEEVAGKLLDQGANENEIDKAGWTALHLAAGYGSYEVVQLLLGKGVDANLMTKDKNKWTALHVAVNGIQRRGRYKDVIRILLQKMKWRAYKDLGCPTEPCSCDPNGREKLVCDALDMVQMKLPFFSRGREFTSASPAKSPSSVPNDNFISFLATAQMRDVDFLPIVWQTDLDRVAIGGTAVIRQSFLNLKLSYAFKRIRRDKVNEPYAFHALSSEVFILGHREIRGHDNIVRLVGICWDVVSANEPIWPVLVFQKSQYGDLEQFMESKAGLELDLRARMKLCTDIAAAIVLMHSHGIIHGDIKPGNVLMFHDEENGYTAKVGDFGYSVLSEGDINEKRIHLPMSIPWNAPEVISWEILFSLHAAKLTDVYSFGLLSLWLLFPKMSRNVFSGIKDIDSDMKDDKELLQTVTSLIESTAELDTCSKTGLRDFFASTLANEPNDRKLDLKEMMRSFTVFEVPPLPNQGFSGYDMWIPYLKWLPHHKAFDPAATQAKFYEELGQYHGESSDPGSSSLYNPYSVSGRATSVKSSFQLSKSFQQFMEGDYRLWEHIFKSLKDETSDPPASQEEEHVAFELALCYQIGFGTERSTAEAASWLQKSKRNNEDLRGKIDVLKADKNPLLYKNLETEIRMIDYMSHYQQTAILADVEQAYRIAANNSESIFGEDHPLSIFLNRILGFAYQAEGDHGRAQVIFEKVAAICQEWLGPRHPHTLTSLASVALGYRIRGQLELAEELEVKIMDGVGQRHSEDSPSMVRSMERLAAIYKDQKRWDAAESLELKIFRAYENTIGADHPDTLSAMADLVLNYKNQGQLIKTEEFGLGLLGRTANIAGKESEDIADAMDALSSIYESQERWNDMVDMANRATQIRKRILGPEHEDTLLSTLTLARAYSNQGKLDEALKIQTEAVDTAKRIFGLNHTNTLIAMHNLAFILKESNRDHEAISLMREVVSLQERVLGRSHPHTVSSADALLVFRRLAGEEVDQQSLDRICGF